MGGFGELIAKIFAVMVARTGLIKQVGVGAGGATIIDWTIDQLRAEAVKIAPTSDPEALEEAARQLMRMLGLDGSDVLFPPGGPSNWNYFHMDMRNGRTWFTRKYISRNSVKGLMRAMRAAPTRIVPSSGSTWRRGSGRPFST